MHISAYYLHISCIFHAYFVHVSNDEKTNRSKRTFIDFSLQCKSEREPGIAKRKMY